MSELTTTCRGIKAELLAFLEQRVEVSADEGACVITLPIKTVDGRYVQIYVEPTVTNIVMVHDGGNAVTELFLQGIHMTDARAGWLKSIAKGHGVSFTDNTFSTVAKPEGVTTAILAISQCTSLAMSEVLKHVPVLEEERIATIVRRTLEIYRPTEVDIRYGMVVKGKVPDRNHAFDAVVFPRLPNRNAVAIKTLGTGYTPNVQAQLFGFLALDLEGTEYDNWPRLAVIARADKWPSDALKLVRNLSAKTLELKTGDDDDIGRRLMPTIDALAAAA